MHDCKLSLEDRLQAHPHLKNRVEALLNIVEDTAGNVDKADDAEQLVIDELRRLGNDVLHDWAHCKESQRAEETLEKESNKLIKGKKKLFKWYTTFGQIVIEERTFILDGHRIRPFSSSANVTTNSYSRPLERCITDFGADDAFAKVPSKLKEHYGISIPSHAPRTITEKHAKKINDSKSLKDLFPKKGAEYIIAETDGSMIPIVTIAARTTDEEPSDDRKRRKVGWKEARLSLAHPLGSVTPIFDATLGGTEETGNQLLNCVILAGGGENSKVHCVGDGAPWIADQVDRVFSSQGSYLIDMMHLCEYLAPASLVCSPHASFAWLDQQKQRMKEGEISEVLQALKPHIEPLSITKKDTPVKNCYRYITNRPGQFDYKSALEANLPIGSGEIESAHRYVIQKRLKLAGAWWNETNAQNMLALRTLRANGGFQHYWEQDFKQAA